MLRGLSLGWRKRLMLRMALYNARYEIIKNESTNPTFRKLMERLTSRKIAIVYSQKGWSWIYLSN